MSALRSLSFRFARIGQQSRTRLFWIVLTLLVLVVAVIELLAVAAHGKASYSFAIGTILTLLAFIPMAGVQSRRVKIFARRIGWRYIGPTPYADGLNILPSNQIKLFSIPGKKRLSGTISGQLKGLPALLFRYSIRKYWFSSIGLAQFTILIVELPIAVPKVVIDSHRIINFKQYIDFNNSEELHLEGSFGQTHSVYAPKSEDNEGRLLALSILSPDVMEIYEHNFSDCNFICVGNKIAVCTPLDLYSSHQLGELGAAFLTLVPKLERQMRIRGSQFKATKTP